MKISSTDAVAEPLCDDDRFAGYLFDDHGHLIDESDFLEPGECPPEPDLWSDGSAHTAGMNALEDVTIRARMLTAEQYATIAGILRDAAACPDPWVGPDPTLDPVWVDPRERTAGQVRAERRDIAVRAAAADIAVRLRMSETMVRSRACHADTLRERCPRVWEAFLSGRVAEQNAVTAAQLAASLPRTDRVSWAAFDDAVAGPASALPPGKFRLRARVVRERVHAESIDERHQRAAADRNVWLNPELDGMAALNILMPAADAHAAYRRVDAHARHLHDQDGETRTLAQLRADVLAELLIHGETALSGAGAAAASVAITIPALGLLGKDTEPATLDGYGPIDLRTARRLAGGAKSWVRILTHPVTGTVLDVDRKTYRVPKDLRRWLGVRDPVCIFPGCTRIARDCQIDHRVEWQYGGTTSADNAAPECEPHHVIKTKSNWVLYRDEATGATWWVTPTALKVDPDPPPW